MSWVLLGGTDGQIFKIYQSPIKRQTRKIVSILTNVYNF